MVIAEIPVGRPVILIRSLLERDGNDAAARLAKLGIVSGGDHVDLAHRVLRRHKRQPFIVVVGSASNEEGVVVPAERAAGDAVVLLSAIVKGPLGDMVRSATAAVGARCKLRQREDVTAGEGK